MRKSDDAGIMRWATVVGSQFTQTTKTLQIQATADTIPGIPGTAESPMDDALGPWCLVAVPAAPTTDAQGNVQASAEALVAQMGDENISVAMRDTRFAKYAADLLAGEAALFNAFGARAFFKQKQVGIAAFGGSLLFDTSASTPTLSLTGIPASAGAAAPWLTMTPTGIGWASSSGGCSANFEGGTATVTGSMVQLNAQAVNIGANAEDPVITLSYLASLVTALMEQFNLHTHLTAGMGSPSPPFVPLTLTPQGSSTVKATP